MQPPIHHRGCMLSLHFPEGCGFFRGIAAKRDNGKDVSPSWALALPLFRLLLARMLFPYRKYIPKKSNFDNFSNHRIMQIQKKLNARPREKLNFDTPKNCFFKNFY